MPRRPRLHVPGGIYHAVLRGNHRQPIFSGPGDRERLDEIIADVIRRLDMRVHAYCWMSNHIHLAIQVDQAPLGEAMRRIASRYARHAQRRIPTTGHLFERRYRAVLVDTDSYLLDLVRYVHLNPVKAGLVADPADYPWSSHRAYLGIASTPWITRELVLRTLSDQREDARDAYRRFMLPGLEAGGESDAGFETGSARDSRILGDDGFLSRVKNVEPLGRTVGDLEMLIERVCRLHGTSTAELSAPVKTHKAAQVRSVILWHAMRTRVATLTQIARRFERAPSTLAETLQHYRRTAPALFDLPPGVLSD